MTWALVVIVLLVEHPPGTGHLASWRRVDHPTEAACLAARDWVRAALAWSVPEVHLYAGSVYAECTGIELPPDGGRRYG